MFRRLVLFFLLSLFLFGFAGHLLMSVEGMHSGNSESACAMHAGIVFPEPSESTWNEPVLSPEPDNDNTRAICLAAKISHPPTF